MSYALPERLVKISMNQFVVITRKECLVLSFDIDNISLTIDNILPIHPSRIMSFGLLYFNRHLITIGGYNTISKNYQFFLFNEFK